MNLFELESLGAMVLSRARYLQLVDATSEERAVWRAELELAAAAITEELEKSNVK